jgi:hypothetical protein
VTTILIILGTLAIILAGLLYTDPQQALQALKGIFEHVSQAVYESTFHRG